MSKRLSAALSQVTQIQNYNEGGLEWSFPPLSPSPFQEVHSGLYGVALTDEKSKQKQFETLGLQTTLPSQ